MTRDFLIFFIILAGSILLVLLIAIIYTIKAMFNPHYKRLNDLENQDTLENEEKS